MSGELLEIKILNWDKFQGNGKRFESTHWFRLNNRILAHPLWSELNSAELRVFIGLLAIVSRDGHQLGRVSATLGSFSASTRSKRSTVWTALEKLSAHGVVEYQVLKSFPRSEKEVLQYRTGHNSTVHAQPHIPENFFEELVGEYAGPPLFAKTSIILSSYQRMAANKLWSQKPNEEYWRSVLERAQQSSFLCGQIPPKDSRPAFRFSIQFLLRPETHLKIMSGEYDDERLEASRVKYEYCD